MLARKASGWSAWKASLKTALVAAVLPVAALSSSARAGDTPVRGFAPPSGGYSFTAVSRELAGTPLTNDGLHDLLDRMGFEPEPFKNINGDTLYRIKVERNGWTFRLIASISNDGRFLWLSSPLTEITDPAKASPEALMRLMAQNFELGPSYFEVRRDKWIYMSRPVPNKSLGASELRREIDALTGDIEKTEPAWRLATLMPAGGLARR